ncbi:MAG TPA: hypothetical protein VFQ85_04580 [Mycobacteriales bacterium]|jgi:hypothetical protein|nr:hypothetical protein [Mycobacteriales bacterium]
MRRVRRAVAVVLAVVTLTAPYALAAAPPPRLCVEPVLTCPKPKPAPAPKPKPKPRDLSAYHGLGTWVDAYDFSREYKGRIAPSAVDDMAAQGVKTLYIQGAKDRNGGETGVLSPDLLGDFLERAHAKKIKVVAWYLPRFVDANRDWGHLDALLKFRSAHGQAFDSIGVDIESTEQSDLKTRNDRLVALSTKLRNGAGTMATSAIVIPPVVTDKINTKYWPDFPWERLKGSYDVWIPMAYYTNRTKQPEWRDAYKYVTENVKLLRGHVGSAAVVHAAGGVGTDSTSADYDGLVRGATDAKCVGASSYDYGVTARGAWATLRKSPS